MIRFWHKNWTLIRVRIDPPPIRAAYPIESTMIITHAFPSNAPSHEFVAAIPESLRLNVPYMYASTSPRPAQVNLLV